MITSKERAVQTISKFASARTQPQSERFENPCMASLHAYLKDSVLVENVILSDRTQKALITSSANVYYGTNVSGVEPLDQIDSMLIARQISRYLDNSTTVLIAGKFGLFNSNHETDLGERVALLDSRDLEKKGLIQAIFKHLQLSGETLLTRDLWADDLYWHIFGELYRTGLIPETRVYPDIEQRIFFSSIPRAHLGQIPDEVFELLAKERAVNLYSVAEIAEALYLSERFSSIIKIDPSDEKEYDDYIKKSLDIVHLTQPVDLRSTPAKLNTVVPYIVRQGAEKNRILFSDSSADILRKLQALPDAPKPLFYANTINPLLRLMAYTHEAERAASVEQITFAERLLKAPLTRSGMEKSEGEQKVVYSLMRSAIGEIAAALHEIIIEPIDRLVRHES